MTTHHTGQALVEFALVAPILMVMLLGVLGAGLYFLSAGQQQAATVTLAQFVAQHPADDPTSFADAVTPCPGGATIAIDEHLVSVTIDCPSLAGELVGALPKMVTTHATAYLPEPSGAVLDALGTPEPSGSVAP